MLRRLLPLARSGSRAFRTASSDAIATGLPGASRVRLTAHSVSGTRPSLLAREGLLQPASALWTTRILQSASDSAQAASADVEETFQSETRRILDIVTHSLYTEREIFLRELISNASDALEKRRYKALSSGAEPGPLEIRITTSTDGKTLTLEDTGIGMTRKELVENLGTIARSGTRAFLDKLAADGKTPSENLIGRFGVGFYSAFMVADRIDVYTSAGAGGDGAHKWSSAGDGQYTIRQAQPDEAPEQGTRMVLHLKEDAKYFSFRAEIDKVIKKYSNFVSFPVVLDGDRVNTIQALWGMAPKDVTEEMHAEFYKFISGDKQPPAFKLHFQADAPLSVKAALYIPSSHAELTLAGLNKSEPGVSLYSNRVLIQANALGILPPYLRFVKGVVDCEDVPLNISRELLQDGEIVRKLRTALKSRILKFMLEQAKATPEEYEKWYRRMGIFVKEGVCTEEEPRRKEDWARLLRYETTTMEQDQVVSLEAHVERRKEKEGEEPKELYYLVSNSREQALASPYLEAFRQKGTEVLLLYSPADDIVMKLLLQFKGIKLVNAEDSKLEAETQADGDAMPEERVDALTKWLGEGVLAGKVQGVRPSKRLVDSPAVLTGIMSQSMRQLQRATILSTAGEAAAKAADVLATTGGYLEINVRHPLIKQIADAALGEDEARKKVAALCAEQVLDSARVSAGSIDDPRAMLQRMNEICEAALNK